MTSFVILIVFVILSVFALYIGREIIFSSITSFYPAIVVYKAFPYIDSVILLNKSSQQIFYSHLLVFIIIFLPIFFAVQRVIYASGGGVGIWGIIDATLLSISVISLSLVLTLHILPTRDIYNLTSGVLKFFNSPLGYFISLVIPLGVVFHISKRAY